MSSCRSTTNEKSSKVSGSKQIGHSSIGVTDGSAGPGSFVGKLRRQVWGEFLQLDPEDPKLADPLAGVGEFERQAALGDARVRRYYPMKMGDSWAENEVYKIYEPDGRCYNSSAPA